MKMEFIQRFKLRRRFITRSCSTLNIIHFQQVPSQHPFRWEHGIVCLSRARSRVILRHPILCRLKRNKISIVCMCEKKCPLINTISYFHHANAVTVAGALHNQTANFQHPSFFPALSAIWKSFLQETGCFASKDIFLVLC